MPLEALIRKRYVLLDRDGTLIVERNYLRSVEQIEWLPAAIAGLRAMTEMGVGLIILTNQSGIGRGLFTASAVEQVHQALRAALERAGVKLDAIYYCPHTPEDACQCRKPKPEMARRAAADFGFDLREAFMIGDKPADMEMGRACGARTILVRTGYGRGYETSGLTADFIADDLLQAAEMMRRDMQSSPSPVLVSGAAERLRRHVSGSIETKQKLLAECEVSILAAAEAVTNGLRDGGKIMLCGNGGSAADSQHIAAEFVSVLNQSFLRPGLPALALTTDTSILTASANDFGFEGIFARQVQALGRPGDVLIGISTSGNSENVLRAFRYAREHGMRTIGLTGSPGGKFPAACDVCIRVPAASTQFIQESHIMIGHILCDLAEQSLRFD